ncbi:MAG: MBL fold metallo-hydrolase [Agathobacter sp.]|nr:MBL fold metallo-hydrolase [Agathobacter sp.]
MQIKFIHHSCFLVEVDDKVLIFDYFDGDKVNGFTFTGEIPEYEPDTKIYMFASHSHKDHYDMDILRWAEKYENIKYIFSKDIKISPNFLKKHGIDPKVRERVTFVTADKKYKLDDLNIKTLRSTDAGVAYYVETNGATFYHGGDLNSWIWDGAGDLTNGVQMRNYKFQIHQLAGLPINVAFVPMDPRQGMYTYSGFEYFLQETEADIIFPMHMWQDYSPIARFKGKLTNPRMAERIMDIERENQEFYIAEN